MAKRNRNRKRKNKESVTKEETEIIKETQSNTKEENEVTEVTEVTNEKSISKVTEEKTKIEPKKSALLTQILVGSFVVLFALPSIYYFSKISPAHTAEIDKLAKENQVKTKELETKLSDALKAKEQSELGIKKEKELNEKKLNEKLKSSTTKEQELKEKLEKVTQDSKNLNIELLATQTKVIELEKKMIKEAKTKYELQKQLILLVTKGKELEDKFKKLESSIDK